MFKTHSGVFWVMRKQSNNATVSLLEIDVEDSFASKNSLIQEANDLVRLNSVVPFMFFLFVTEKLKKKKIMPCEQIVDMRLDFFFRGLHFSP